MCARSSLWRWFFKSNHVVNATGPKSVHLKALSHIRHTLRRKVSRRLACLEVLQVCPSFRERDRFEQSHRNPLLFQTNRDREPLSCSRRVPGARKSVLPIFEEIEVRGLFCPCQILASHAYECAGEM